MPLNIFFDYVHINIDCGMQWLLSLIPKYFFKKCGEGMLPVYLDDAF